MLVNSFYVTSSQGFRSLQTPLNWECVDTTVLPFIDTGFQLVELFRNPSDIIQQALGVNEGLRLAELSAEAAEGLQLTGLLLQLGLDLLQNETKSTLKLLNANCLCKIKSKRSVV